MAERQNDRIADSCRLNKDSCSILKKKLILQKFLRMYDKSNTLILASLCTNPSGKGREEFRVERV